MDSTFVLWVKQDVLWIWYFCVVDSTCCPIVDSSCFIYITVSVMIFVVLLLIVMLLSGLDFIRLVTRVLWIGLSFQGSNFYFNGTFCFLFPFFLFWEWFVVFSIGLCPWWELLFSRRHFFFVNWNCCLVHDIRCESKLDLLFYGRYLFWKLGFLFK